MTAVNSMCN